MTDDVDDLARLIRPFMPGMNHSRAQERADEIAQRIIAAGWRGPTEKAKFVQQTHGALVATIRETDDGLLEVQDLRDGTFDLVVHSRIRETDRFEDLSIKLKPAHFAMLGSIGMPPGSPTPQPVSDVEVEAVDDELRKRGWDTFQPRTRGTADLRAALEAAAKVRGRR